MERAAASSELSGSDRRAVARELAQHFHDGLAGGTSAEELRERFGDPDLAAMLIGRSRTGMQWRLARSALRAAAVCAMALLVFYAGSAVRLGSSRPARLSDDAIVERLASVADLERTARDHLAASLRELSAGDGESAMRALGRAVGVAEELSNDRDFFSRLAGAALRTRIAGVVRSDMVMLRLTAEEIGALVPGRAQALDAEELARWLDDFLSRVYSGPESGGRLTGDGLRLVRALKGGREEPLHAMLLEPLYFARPAKESEVRAQATLLLALSREALAAGGEASLAELEDRLHHLSDSGRRAGLLGAAYYPLMMAMSRVPDALAADRLAR